MFLERFKEVENFTITKLPLGGSNTFNSTLFDYHRECHYPATPSEQSAG